MDDRDVIRAILKHYLKETSHRHLRAVENQSTQTLEDTLVGYCEGIRAQLIAERLIAELANRPHD